MGKDYDLERVGKRMPYTTPPDFFDTLERRIEEKTLGNASRPPLRRRMRRKAGIWVTATAAVATVTAVTTLNVAPDDRPQATPSNTELAFANLSAEDQEYFMGILDDDVFFSSDDEIYIDEQ